MTIRILAAAGALLVLAQPALAAPCVVDYDTFAVREAALADPASMFAEQQGETAAWYINNETVTMRDARYVKFGLPRVLPPGELAFWGFKSSVPFTVEAGTTDAKPGMLYALANPAECAFQPYQLVD